MKKTISLLLALVLLLTAIPMVFTSCSEKEDDPGADIHVFLSSRLYDLDPTMAIVDDDAAQVLSLLYEPLFKLKADGKVDYALAKSYKINKTDREMTITLRKTYWSDSKLVTADDIVFAWQRILDPAFENPAAALLYDIENALFVIEYKGYFAKGLGFSFHRTAEDNVLHVAATKILCGLFAKYPTDSVRYVTLTATIRTNDTGYPAFKADYRFVGKRLKADKMYFF